MARPLWGRGAFGIVTFVGTLACSGAAAEGCGSSDNTNASRGEGGAESSAGESSTGDEFAEAASDDSSAKAASDAAARDGGSPQGVAGGQESSSAQDGGP